MKRFITYLDGLARRTYFGTDGTEPVRSGVLGYFIEGLGECQDFCVWGGYSRGSPTRLPFVFCDAVCQT